MKKYTFYKKEMEEQEIDLMALCSYVLAKWRTYILLGVIGLVIGAPIGVLMAKREQPDPDDLAPSIVAQLDNYANQKALDEKLNADDRELYIMSLDPNDTYYETTVEYTVRTDNREDALLAAKYLDITSYREYLDELAAITGYEGYINNLRGFLTYSQEVSEATENQGMTYFNQGQNTQASGSSAESDESISKETISDIQSAISDVNKGKKSGTEELENILSTLNKKGQAYATLTYTVSYMNEANMKEFLTWLDGEITRVGTENCTDYSGYKLKKVRSTMVPLRPTQVETYQQTVNAAIAERSTATDIRVETMLSKYATTIAATDSSDGFTAIITDKEKKEYEKYWYSISDPEYEGGLSKITILKWMIIIGVLFGIMGAGVAMVKYLAMPPVVDEAMLRDIYRLDIIGYVKEGQEEKKGLDKIFDREPAGMEPTSYAYVSGLMAANAEKDICIIKTETERDITALTEALKKAGKKVCCGDITTDMTMLEAAKNSSAVYLAAELSKTTAGALEATLHLMDMYEISLDGVVML